jgi:hypothetical protein
MQELSLAFAKKGVALIGFDSNRQDAISRHGRMGSALFARGEDFCDVTHGSTRAVYPEGLHSIHASKSAKLRLAAFSFTPPFFELREKPPSF